MRLVFTVFLFVLATSARAGPAADIGRLAWMAGAWIEETPKATTRETCCRPWTAPWPGRARPTSPVVHPASST